ncbi:membrane integrity-associated transporter subunit PqiA [Thorsellia anophelis]|uniref:Paraquat-inducible protein A n=1 Tax=Thorsellia anophelis DSM 18579 TaxID=1123402 RepID=A0A1I0APF1_9GAMM|nr:membrane integrity-associated transporter subunit PqiA [Thorsellia anophelis]SES95645.1 paraquat-inducible protein A [Thorsellia anophelis DSM 18579]
MNSVLDIEKPVKIDKIFQSPRLNLNQALCPHCDLVVDLPRLKLNQKADCPRCHTTLKINWSEPFNRATTYSAAALFMLILANLFTFVSLSVAGLSSNISLTSVLEIMVDQRYDLLALLFMIFVQILPAFCMFALFCISTRMPMPYRLKIFLAKWLILLKPWCMVEIFLVGVLVSFVKLMSYGSIDIGPSFIAFCAYCILHVRAFQYADKTWIWGTIAKAPDIRPLKAGVSGLEQQVKSCHCCGAILVEQSVNCTRCFTTSYARKKESIQITLALLIGSIVLYIPANVLPIMTTLAFGSSMDSTIMAGVVLLWGGGAYPIALIIFIASVLVPSLKMGAIAWLCWCTKTKKVLSGHRMMQVYEVVELVGRWSMVDVFVIAVLVGLVSFGNLMNIFPAQGVIYFAFVVIVTMVASVFFDPRLMWDRRSENLKRKLETNKRSLHLGITKLA